MKINLFRFQAIMLFTCLLFLISCQSETKDGKQEAPPSAFLPKTLAYHDPEENWPKLKTRLYLSSTDTAGKENTFEIELDNLTGYFAHIHREDGKEIVKGMARGKEFYLLNGKTEISAAERKQYELTPEGVQWVYRFYGYLYGLPMKLTDESAQLLDAPTQEKIGDKTYQVLQVTYDPVVGQDNWFFYLDPETYALQAYRFNHGEPGSGEYILLKEEEMVQGIKIPKVRQWYLNKNNKYLGTDTLLKAEPLSSLRI